MMLASKANMFLGSQPQPSEYWGMYFEAEEANCVVNMNTYYTSGGVRTTVNLESSRDGVTWTDFDGNSTTGTTPVTLANIGDRVYIRSKGTTDGNAFAGDGSAKFYRYFTLSKKAGAHGSIMSLVNGSEQKTSFPADWFFLAAFDSCAKLTTAPELPVTSLRKGCYNNLFWGCTGLTTPPELPATSLAVNCYQYMFAGCTALTTAPELPATNVDSYAYSHMFEGCTSLTAAPDIYAQLGSYGCENMFKGCTSLTTAQGRIRGVMSHSCRFMFQNCTSLTTAPYLQSLGDNTTYEPYRAMFSGCSRLSSISVGFASWTIGGYVATPSWVSNVAASGTLTCPAALGTNATISRGTSYCPTGWNVYNPPAYWGFYIEAEEANCVVNMENHKTGSSIVGVATNLEYSTDGSTWTTFDAANSYSQGSGSSTGSTPITLANIGDRVYFRSTNNSTDGNMFYKSNDSYNYYYKNFTLSAKASAHGNIMSLIWDNQNAVTINRASQFRRLFYNCTNLTAAPDLPATTITSYCYRDMFEGCTSLTTAPQTLPATTVPTEAYRRMFYGCTSLTAAPNISATSIGVLACESMFYGCSALATAPQSLPATTIGESTYEKMFYNCASLVKAPNIGATTIGTKAMRDMFDGCTSLNEIRVAFTTWQDAGVNLSNWVYNVAATGTFKCPSALGTNANITRGSNNCPTGWTVQNV